MTGYLIPNKLQTLLSICINKSTNFYLCFGNLNFTTMTEIKRDGFGSRFGVLVAVAGSAVGLGNLWRFPYLVGNNGGAAFIIMYLSFVIVLCLPIMFSEFIIGRRTQ